MRRLLAVLVVGMFAGGAIGRQDQPETSGAPRPAPYMRIVEEDGGATVKLQMTVREFKPSKEGRPRVYLAGAVHIGERAFYEGLQTFLDAQEVVLFEGVKPPGAGAADHDGAEVNDEEKAAATKRRVRFVASAVRRFSAQNDGKLPESLDQLVAGSEGRIAALLSTSIEDSWGETLKYLVLDGGKGYDVQSYGADRKPGGDGAAADIRFSDQKPLAKPETGDRSGGLQTKLAKAMGLEFQLTAMNHNKANWRNSDLSVDQVQARLEKSGANADALFGMLEGSSMMGRLGGALLGFIGSTPDGQAMLRVMIVEVLGRADAMMESMPGGMGKMMGVIIEDRNRVVLDDLRKLSEGDKPPAAVAVIYGAGHLPSMERALVEEMGYTPVGDEWRTAISVSAAGMGVAPAQIKATRQMIQRMMEQQTKRRKPAGPPKAE